jgi:hypothetical protein
MHRPGYGIFSTAASALMALFGQSAAALTTSHMNASLFPVSPVTGPRKRKYKGRTGKHYQTGNGQRENMRNARLAAKMRSTRTMNDDMLVRHRPANSGPGMDMTVFSRPVLRAEERRDAKARARNLKSSGVPANWRQVIAMDRAVTTAARAAE